MFLGMKTKAVAWNSESVLEAVWFRCLELEMTSVKHHLFPQGKWWCLVASSNVVVSNVELLSGWWLMHDCWPLLSHGSILQRVPWSSYKVSPNHTHKQDTITDMQRGCPFVWFMGDVVANVASVSLRGSGKLQIFPSQQEVQTLWPSCSESLQPVDKHSSSGTQRLVTEMLFPVTSIVCWVKQYLVSRGQ